MPNNTLTQGALANRSGRILEDTLLPMFRGTGYTVFDRYSDWCKGGRSTDEYERLIIRSIPYTTIYGGRGKTEFLLVNNSGEHPRKIRIECKWQASAGSVDEKFPYLYLNAVFAYPEQEIILLVDGNGYKRTALEWLREQVQNRWLLGESEKSIRVMNLSGFMEYFTRELA